MDLFEEKSEVCGPKSCVINSPCVLVSFRTSHWEGHTSRGEEKKKRKGKAFKTPLWILPSHNVEKNDLNKMKTELFFFFFGRCREHWKYLPAQRNYWYKVNFLFPQWNPGRSFNRKSESVWKPFLQDVHPSENRATSRSKAFTVQEPSLFMQTFNIMPLSLRNTFSDGY